MGKPKRYDSPCNDAQGIRPYCWCIRAFQGSAGMVNRETLAESMDQKLFLERHDSNQVKQNAQIIRNHHFRQRRRNLMSFQRLKKVIYSDQEANRDDLMNLKLTPRTYNALRRGNVTTISKLASITPEQLPQIRLLGEKGLQEIAAALSKYRCQDPSIRSLYQCFNARVKGAFIRCTRGHSLSTVTGTISIEALATGKPLILKVCQDCAGYDEMGPAVPPSERGWIH